jgi:beta-phosphoglucomutase-like phosphatase (HAD superfamily)
VIKAAIFDLDGTLIDSMGFWMSEGIDLLTKYGIKDAISICQRYVPKSMYETCTYVSNNYKLNISEIELRSEWEQRMERHYMSDVILKGNVLSALEYLAKNEYKLLIATATKYELTKKVLKRLKIDTYFDTIVTTSMVNKSKDHPDVYIKCAQTWNLQANECVVFEDAYHGIRTAKKAGFYVVAVDEKTMVPYEDIVKEYCSYYLIDYLEVPNLAILSEKK